MLALIPVRGGSKGLPGKNLMPLGGISLLERTIRCAREAQRVDRVVVTTDDEALAQAALAAGAEVPFIRPAELASDDARSIDVYLHACDELFPVDAVHAAAFVALQVTTPLREPADIDGAIDLFHATDATSVIGCCEAPCPIAWYHELDQHGRMHQLLTETTIQANRQEHPQHVVPNGALYVLRYQHLAANGTFYGPSTRSWLMDRERSVDIDEPIDLAIAEALLRKREEYVP